MSDGSKKILILNGHPDSESFCRYIADNYEAGAKEAGFEVKRINIADVKFEMNLQYGYRKRMELEPDLLQAQQDILWCEHLVIVTPVWWGTLPACLKGFFDRTFLGGFSHRFNPAKKLPEKLLTGRSASVLYTQGGPKIFSYLIMGDAFWKVLKRCILNFCGFSPVKRKIFDRIKGRTEKEMADILTESKELGGKGF